MKAATYPSSAREKTQPAPLAIHEEVAIKICNFTWATILTSSCRRLFPTHTCVPLISLPSTVSFSPTTDPLPPCHCLLFIRGRLSNVENVLSSSSDFILMKTDFLGSCFKDASQERKQKPHTLQGSQPCNHPATTHPISATYWHGMSEYYTLKAYTFNCYWIFYWWECFIWVCLSSPNTKPNAKGRWEFP